MKFPLKEALFKNKTAIAFLLLVIFGLIAIYIFASASYPIAMVGRSPISLDRLEENYKSASIYYDNILKTYRSENGESAKPSEKELEAEVFTQLIEAKLIDRAVEEEVGKDLEYLVANKIEKYRENENLKTAAPTLYGMEFEEFWTEVLIPQAKRDILAGRLFLKGEKIEDWLVSAKKDAKIILFTKDFNWTGEKVEPAN